MRIVIQRVTHACVRIGGETVAEIGNGMLLLLGIAPDDTVSDIDYLCRKISKLRIFDDAEGRMNADIQTVNGQCLVVSQFTLYADTRKGNRPFYGGAAGPETAGPLYEAFIARLQEQLGRDVPHGKFGANMQVSLCNDGPVTILLDSKAREVEKH